MTGRSCRRLFAGVAASVAIASGFAPTTTKAQTMIDPYEFTILDRVEYEVGIFGYEPSLNDAGVVAYLEFKDGAHVRFFTNDGTNKESVRSILLTGTSGLFEDSFAVSINNHDGRLNNNGKAAFAEIYGTETPLLEQRVLLLPLDQSSPAMEIVDGLASNEVDAISHVSVNDHDIVAFTSSRANDGVKSVFTSGGGALTKIVDSIGPFDRFSRGVSINAAGRVVFAGSLDVGGVAIFRGPDPVADRVIGSGDRIGGRTVRGVQLGPEGLNERGQIAFRVRFEDFSTAIVRADPRFQLPPDLDRGMQLSTGLGTSTMVSQAVPSPLLPDKADLAVATRFLTTTGDLVVRVLGEEVGRVVAPSTLRDKVETSVFPVNLRKLLSDHGDQDEVTLSLEFKGVPGSVIQIAAVDLPGLRNGDFSEGYLDSWDPYISDGAVSVVVMQPQIQPY